MSIVVEDAWLGLIGNSPVCWTMEFTLWTRKSGACWVANESTEKKWILGKNSMMLPLTEERKIPPSCSILISIFISCKQQKNQFWLNDTIPE
jgi:hypothetical protein